MRVGRLLYNKFLEAPLRKTVLSLLACTILLSCAFAQDASHVKLYPVLNPNGPSHTLVYRPGQAALPPSSNITYYGGPIISVPVNVYVVYYGKWSSIDRGIIDGFIKNLSGSPLYNINAGYYDNSTPQNFVQNVVNYTAKTNAYHDNYSLGKTLSDAQTQTIITNAINGGHLANDTNGVYFVLTAKDVHQNAFGGSFCSLYCGYHGPSTTIISGETIKYSFVGNPAQCPTGCDGNVAIYGDKTSPNSDIGADGVTNVLFHELSESVTDPEVNMNTAWQAGSCGENGDCCNFTFGTTSKGTNGAHYNQTINGVNYLVQEMFKLTGTGFTSVTGVCAQSR